MKKSISIVLICAVVFIATACNPPMMTNWGWWKARDPGTRQSITIDVHDDFGFDWVAAMAPINQLAGWDLIVPAGWRGVANENADVVFQQIDHICPVGGWNGYNCPDQRSMWAPSYVPDPNAPFITRCTIYWDPTYWEEPSWRYVFHWMVIMHEIMHCLGYPDVIPPTSYLGSLSYYAFWDQNWRNTYWWTANGDDPEMFIRDGYRIS